MNISSRTKDSQDDRDLDARSIGTRFEVSATDHVHKLGVSRGQPGDRYADSVDLKARLDDTSFHSLLLANAPRGAPATLDVVCSFRAILSSALGLADAAGALTKHVKLQVLDFVCKHHSPYCNSWRPRS